MNWDDALFDLFLAVLPAVIVFMTAFVMLKKFFDEKRASEMVELRKATSAAVLPNKLQAYERMVLFLERISPDNLVMRIQRPGMSANLLHSNLLQTIRNEYEHNMAQQIYITIETWEKIKTAKEETARLINIAKAKLNSSANSMDLSKMIFAIQDQVGKSPTADALLALKQDMKRYF